MGTTDVLVTLDVQSPEEDARLVDALDQFLGLKLERQSINHERDEGVIVRTAFDAEGRLHKKLIFQDRQWADDFLSFWAERRVLTILA